MAGISAAAEGYAGVAAIGGKSFAAGAIGSGGSVAAGRRSTSLSRDVVGEWGATGGEMRNSYTLVEVDKEEAKGKIVS